MKEGLQAALDANPDNPFLQMHVAALESSEQRTMNELTPDQIHDILAAVGRIVRVARDTDRTAESIRMTAAINKITRVMERIAPEYIDGWANQDNEPPF